MENFKLYIILIICFVAVLFTWRLVKLSIKKFKSNKKKLEPTCFNCIFHTPYQMLNNRDERVDVNHCSVLSARIKSIHGNYIQDMAVSINDPITFSCNQHKQK